ncbi:hypothetical protein RS3R6_45300 [Pseudomonas atacamensis]|nr:hypothetical protein RS3R6_45300 [Pseudomonas atacamensis]
MPALMIDPVGNLFAGGCEARLAGVEQGEEGGDGLFFGHETPPFAETAELQQKVRVARTFRSTIEDLCDRAKNTQFNSSAKPV